MVLFPKIKTGGDDYEKVYKGFIDYLLLDEKNYPLCVLEAKSESREQLYREKNRIVGQVKTGGAHAIADKMLAYLDDFKDIFERGEPERKKDFIRKFVKSVIMYPKIRQAKITLYTKPLSDIGEGEICEPETEEITYQN